MLTTQPVPIHDHTYTGQLHDQLSALGARCLVEVLQPWCRGEIKAVPQNDARANYADKLEKREANIDWSKNAAQIHRLIRAFNPWPVAQTEWQGKKIRIWEARISSEANPADCVPGEVLCCDHSAFRVATGSGSLLLEKVQLAGKKPLSHSEFANGRDLQGTVLGGSAPL